MSGKQFVEARLGTLGSLHCDGSLLLFLREPFTSHLVLALLVGEGGLGLEARLVLALAVGDFGAEPCASEADESKRGDAKGGDGDHPHLVGQPFDFDGRRPQRGHGAGSLSM